MNKFVIRVLLDTKYIKIPTEITVENDCNYLKKSMFSTERDIPLEDAARVELRLPSPCRGEVARRGGVCERERERKGERERERKRVNTQPGCGERARRPMNVAACRCSKFRGWPHSRTYPVRFDKPFRVIGLS